MPNPPINFPASYTPAMAMTFANPDSSAQLVSAANPLPVNALEPAPSVGSVTSAGVVVQASTNGFQGGSFQITSIGTGNTVSFEQSNDNVNWVVLPVQNAQMLSGFTSTAAMVGAFNFVSQMAYVRARVSPYGSGTVSVVLAQKAVGQPIGTNLGGSGAQIGTVNASYGFIDSTTALGAAATFTGTARTTSSYNPHSFFTAFAYADQAGTLYIDWSLDNGATWQAMSSIGVPAGTTQTLTSSIPAFGSSAQLRVRFVNGAVAQGTFRLASSFTAN